MLIRIVLGFVLVTLVACGDRPLSTPGCILGLDGGPVYCESTHAAASSCEACVH